MVLLFLDFISLVLKHSEIPTFSSSSGSACPYTRKSIGVINSVRTKDPLVVNPWYA